MKREGPPMSWDVAARIHYLDASRGGRPTLAAETLIGLLKRDVRPIVEVRCPDRGHFLAAVHSTRYGPLFWTYTTRKRLSPAFRQASQRAAPEKYSERPLAPLSFRMCDFEDGVRGHVLVKDSGWFPGFCRCGQRGIVIDDVFDAARTAMAANRKVTLTAQVVTRFSTT